MSELQRSFAKAKLAGLPLIPPGEEEEDDFDTFKDLPVEHPDDDSSSASSASSASSTGTIRPTISKNLFARPNGTPNKRSHSPLPWTQFFERELWLEQTNETEKVVYHAYLTSPTGNAPLFVTHHGAGSCGLSFAVLASEIRKLLPTAGILSIDARGHGSTTIASLSPPSTTLTSDEQLSVPLVDLSLSTLTTDLYTILNLTKSSQSWKSLPPLLLIGHSLGGAVISNLAYLAFSAPPANDSNVFSTTVVPGYKDGSYPNRDSSSSTSFTPHLPKSTFNLTPNSQNEFNLPSLLAYAVLDVVEGSALDALQSMHNYLSTRPSTFRTIEESIDWHIRSRTIRNALSARVSVPGLLTSLEQTKSSDTNNLAEDGENETGRKSSEANTGIEGEGAEIGSENSEQKAKATKKWTWKTDLAATQSFWEGWFVGLSRKFLSARGGKLLLLAGTDRLDKELMIGQMQGKYALQVFPEAGHFIHEDLPAKTAGVIVDFWKRNDGKGLVLPPKVGDILRK